MHYPKNQMNTRHQHLFPHTRCTAVFAAVLTMACGSGAWAACADAASGNPALTASAGSVCNASLTTYTGNNVAGAFDNGSVLNLLAGTSITTTSNTGTFTLSSGGLNTGAVGARPAAAVVHAMGNLKVTSRGNNSRGIFVYGGANGAGDRSRLQVDGDLVVLRSTHSGGAIVQNNGGVIDVTGSARLGASETDTTAAPVDGIRNSASSGTEGTNVFRQGLTIYSSATGIINAAGLVQVQAQPASINSTANTAINISAGTIDMPVPADVLSTSGTALVATGGQVLLGGTALASTAAPVGSSTIKIGTQAVTVRGANAIQAYANGGNTLEMSGGTVSGTAGDAIAVSSGGADNRVDVLAGQVSSTSGRAIFDGSSTAGTAVTLASAAVVTGGIVLGAGSDSLTVNGTDLSQVPTVDGGDDAATADGYIDRLTLSGMSGAQNAGKFVNWERIVLTGSSDLTWTGSSIATGSGSVSGEAMGMVVDGGSTLKMAAAAFSITGDLTNNGRAALNNSTTGDALTVTGNYTGGGTVALDVTLGDSSSAADRLIVGGNTTAGPTTLAITNVGGAGADTTGNGILVVQVAGTSAANSFALPGPGYIDVNGHRYRLVQVGTNWYLQATAVPPVDNGSGEGKRAIPTLGTWSVLALSSLVAMFGIARTRRRLR